MKLKLVTDLDIIVLSLKAPNKNCSRQHFLFFYFYLSKKIRLDFFQVAEDYLETSSYFL